MNNTKKNKFNIVDAFAVIVLIALIFGIVFYVLRENGTIGSARAEKNITYTVCISGVEEEYAAAFDAGKKIYNSSTMEYMGTVTKAEKTAHTENGNTAVAVSTEGEYVLEQKEKPGVCDIYITVTAKAIPDSRGIAYIASERITIGTALYIRVDDFAAESFITAFSLS